MKDATDKDIQEFKDEVVRCYTLACLQPKRANWRPNGHTVKVRRKLERAKRYVAKSPEREPALSVLASQLSQGEACPIVTSKDVDDATTPIEDVSYDALMLVLRLMAFARPDNSDLQSFRSV